MDEFQQARFAVDAIERQMWRDAERIVNQSYALRELAHYLAEHGVSVSRFTRTTQETLVAVALNGDY